MGWINSIDWAATGSMLQGLGTFAGVAAVIWGAVNGATIWKKQKQAERRLEMAERILTATHKGQRALKYVRQTMLLGHELSAAEDKLKENPEWEMHSPSRQKRLVISQTYYNRLHETIAEQIALDECLPLARALFSGELEKALETLRHQFWIVQVDVSAYNDDEHGTDAEFTKKIWRGMNDIKPVNGDKNEVSDTISEAVKVIEKICEPALRLEPIDLQSSSS